MRYCGIDVSAKPANQQLVTLHERRGSDGVELVATFYTPGSVERVARTIEGFGRGQTVVAVDAPSARRLDLLAPGAPAREALRLPEGRYERMRVCDAMLFRRGLPLYPVPAAGQAAADWEQWMLVGFELFEALAGLELFRPPNLEGRYEGRVGETAPALGRLCETYPDAIFCALLGHRPSPKRTPWGLQQRISVLARPRRRRRGRRALAPHARRARRLRRGLHRLRDGDGPGHVGRRPGRGRHRAPHPAAAGPLRAAAPAVAVGSRLGG